MGHILLLLVGVKKRYFMQFSGSGHRLPQRTLVDSVLLQYLHFCIIFTANRENTELSEQAITFSRFLLSLSLDNE